MPSITSVCAIFTVLLSFLFPLNWPFQFIPIPTRGQYSLQYLLISDLTVTLGGIFFKTSSHFLVHMSNTHVWYTCPVHMSRYTCLAAHVHVHMFGYTCLSTYGHVHMSGYIYVYYTCPVRHLTRVTFCLVGHLSWDPPKG